MPVYYRYVINIADVVIAATSCLLHFKVWRVVFGEMLFISHNIEILQWDCSAYVSCKSSECTLCHVLLMVFVMCSRCFICRFSASWYWGLRRQPVSTQTIAHQSVYFCLCVCFLILIQLFVIAATIFVGAELLQQSLRLSVVNSNTPMCIFTEWILSQLMWFCLIRDNCSCQILSVDGACPSSVVPTADGIRDYSWALQACIWGPPKDRRCRTGGYRQTWLRTVEDNLHLLIFSLAMVRQHAWDRSIGIAPTHEGSCIFLTYSERERKLLGFHHPNLE